MTLSGHVDAALELSVVGSFTRIGPAARRRLFRWEPLRAHRLDGRVAVVTGATSGLGRVTAERLAELGAHIVIVARDRARGRRAAGEITSRHGTPVDVVVADLGDLDSVRAAAAELRRRPRIDVLVHNAGALSARHRLTPQGIEATLATHVIGPLLLTELLMPQLSAAPGARVIVVTSGGMYTQPVEVTGLEPDPADYDGVVAYARAKRAQVTLVEACAPRLAARGVRLMAMHPGWADTPGVRSSLPRFHRLTGPLLRSPDEGADTIVWLASAPDERVGEGLLWLDRRPRALHRLARTARSDTPARRRALLHACRRLAGLPALSPAAAMP